MLPIARRGGPLWLGVRQHGRHENNAGETSRPRDTCGPQALAPKRAEGKALRHGRQAREEGLLELPDPRIEPDAYLAGQQSRGIDAQTAGAFRMKSRTYVAFRIESADRPLGVLVIESLRTVEMAVTSTPQCVLQADEIFKILKDEGYGSAITDVLESASFLRAP